jgi:beta-mannosidase
MASIDTRRPNSSAVPVSYDAEVTLGPFSATPDHVAPVAAEVGPGQAQLAWSIPADAYSATPDRFAWISSGSGAFATNRYFFAEIKDVEFGRGHIESEVVRTSADQAVVRLLATGFNYFLRIPTSPQVRFSDNYLDLRDGDVAEITVRGLAENIGDHQLRAVPGLSG